VISEALPLKSIDRARIHTLAISNDVIYGECVTSVRTIDPATSNSSGFAEMAPTLGSPQPSPSYAGQVFDYKHLLYTTKVGLNAIVI
jgi:hypothetical protein